MKPMPCADIERYRRKDLEIDGYGQTGEGTADGIFMMLFKPQALGKTTGLPAPVLRMISGAGEGWEHVSVSLEHRCPTWEEMCWVKDLFWSDDECVIQFHPPKAEYVNCHPYCLHLWKQIDSEQPRPPMDHVGPK